MNSWQRYCQLNPDILMVKYVKEFPRVADMVSLAQNCRRGILVRVTLVISRFSLWVAHFAKAFAAHRC
jgi:hypothetical protein